MAKLLVVFAATGQQGRSVVEAVLADAELSKEYTVRGTSRNPDSASAQQLVKRGIEIFRADIDDMASLQNAFAGANVVFAYSVTVYDGRAYEHERDHGKTLADAAVAAGVPFYIYSTLPNAGLISGGRLKNMGHFDGKQEAEQYARTLPIRSAFVSPGCFMSNLRESMAPRPTGDGSTYALANFVSPETTMPMIDAASDMGKWVTAILADFPSYEGKVLSCATRCYSFQEIADTISKVSGKKVVYKQLPLQIWRGFLPEPMRDHVTEMMQYFEEFGYYGKETDQQVKWAAERARGKLTTLDDYVRANPLAL